MININFDNPYLLLLAIPLLAAVIIPYCLAIRKANRSKSVVASFILHLIIVALVSLAAAGLHFTAIVTKTQVYVLADVSYSANKNLSLVDEHVRAVANALPDNSEMGVVAFGRDCKLVTPLGGKIKSVQDSGVDESATDIKGALDYAGSLFGDGVIKHIVLITDGKQTDKEGADGLINVIERLYEAEVIIDAIYVNDNLPETAKEVQVTSVDYTPSTYLNHAENVDVLLQSNQSGVHATLTLYQGENAIETEYITLQKGYTMLQYPLPTEVDGTFDYRFVLTTEEDAEGVTDEFADNNAVSFTQTVTKQTKVLLLSSDSKEEARFKAMYGEDVEIAFYQQKENAEFNVPFTLEDLIEYDEIILSDIDVSDPKFKNSATFLANLGTAVSQYGKSLLTIGDTNIQNQKDDTLKNLEDMLPVKFGNRDQDPKLMALVIDTSRSMMNASRLLIAKAAAKEALNLLNNQDYVTVISFSGDVSTVWPTSPVKGNRAKIGEMIDAIQPTQGTVIGRAMKEAQEKLALSAIEEKEVMLISDGLSYTHEKDDPVSIAKEMKADGIHTWVINTGNKTGEKSLKNIAVAGNKVQKINNYFNIDSIENVAQIILGKVADVVTESIIENSKGIDVHVKSSKDETLNGVESLPAITGYVYAKAKASATTVLYAEYEKESGAISEAPIYAYWDYGNGKVACLTTSIIGRISTSFAKYPWQNNAAAEQLLKNIYTTNIPKVKHDVPFTETVSYDGMNLQMEFVPATLDYNALVTATITSPDGAIKEHIFSFDSQKFVCEAAYTECGVYQITLTYQLGSKTFTKSLVYHLDYMPEYDHFATYSESELHKAIRSRGTIYAEGEKIKIENDEDNVAMYIFYCTVPFMALAAVLFVVDIIIRKLRWVDIRNLFGNRDNKQKGGRA